jgi:hypothetical protein
MIPDPIPAALTENYQLDVLGQLAERVALRAA